MIFPFEIVEIIVNYVNRCVLLNWVKMLKENFDEINWNQYSDHLFAII